MIKCTILKPCRPEGKKMVYALDGRRGFYVKETLFQPFFFRAIISGGKKKAQTLNTFVKLIFLVNFEGPKVT